MLRLRRTSLVVGSISAIVLCCEIAEAQSVTTTPTPTGITGTGPSITMTEQVNPVRTDKSGAVVAQRPPGLTPLGVNYADCIDDITLNFSVTLSGFDGTVNSLEVWATKSGDCTATTTRGLGGASTNTCWLVNGGLTLPNAEVGQTKQFGVRVQDLVGPQQNPPHGSDLVVENASACTQQPSFAPVPMTVWFLAVDSAGNSNGTPFEYQISTDLIGPPPPVSVTTSVGDTLMQVSWTANTDGDTGGYTIFIDPIPGQEGTEPDATVTSNRMLVCPNSGSPTASDASTDASADASSDASSDAMTSSEDASSADSGCRYVNVGGNSSPTTSATSCATDPILASGFVEDGGTAAVVSVEAGDDAETTDVDADVTSDEASTTIVATGGGGISTIPTNYVLAPNVSTGETVSGETNSTYTITGLKNLTTYNVVVAAVDNSGNVGPPSVQGCGKPAPVDDFWKIYREDGGKAGGFCALDSVGSPAGSALTLVGAGALAIAAVGRRRRRRTG